MDTKDAKTTKDARREADEGSLCQGASRSSCFVFFAHFASSWSGRRRPRAPKFAALLLVFLVSACTLPGSAAPVVKLGVIAPFEGRGRALGYAVLPDIKAAAAEANAAGEFGPYRVTVVAFNDNLDPVTASEQARALALDPDVIGVVGPFSPAAAAAAVPILDRAGIPVQPVESAGLLGKDFSPEAGRAKEAAGTLLQALALDIKAHGRPTRPVASAGKP